MRYIVTPNSLSRTKIQGNRYSFAPSQYTGFYPKKPDRYIPLDELVVVNNKKKKIVRSQKYYYLEIGCIDVDTGCPDYSSAFGYTLPAGNLIELQKDDIVVSTVRTYRKGIGLIDQDFSNIVGTNAFLVVRTLKHAISKEYLLALLRHDFFSEQILSLQNRGMYPRLDKDSLNKVLIPLQRTQDEHDYITVLQRGYIAKQAEIRRKYNLILHLIEKELLNNQKTKKFIYEYPDIMEIKEKNRIDAGIYTKSFKEMEFLIKNYKNGFFYIDKKKIRSGSTPTKRFIGYNSKYKYFWITPTCFSSYGFINKEERINCFRNNLNKNAMLIVNRTSKGGRGEYVGIALFYDFKRHGKGQHNQGVYRIDDYSDLQLQFMTCFMNSNPIREYCAGLSVGSKMKEIKSNQFSTIPFPDFPHSEQAEITCLYHNPKSSSFPPELNTNNFIDENVKWNKQAGILELDASANKIKFRLDEIIHQVVMDGKVEIDFDFLLK